MSKKKLIGQAVLIVLVIATALMFFSSRLLREEQEPQETPAPTERVGDVAAKASAATDPPLREDKSIYDNDDEMSVVTLWMTVREGNEVDGTNHSWADVNTYDAYYYSDLHIPRYKCDVILQVGDENGPLEGEFGYDAKIPNATVQIRGQTSTRSTLKNYKVRIKDGMGEWRGQRTLAINKHDQVALRFTNKLSYDLMKDCPKVIAARTQFIHMYVKDETSSGKENAEFEDYGIYVQVEQLNKTYLENHGLDKHGQFYKVNFFEWNQDVPTIWLKDEVEYDEEAFEEYLEIKGDDDHSKLREVTGAVNNELIPIENVIDTYFDVENLMYWMAFQMLMGNYDTGARNLFLYSPLNSKKWYFISWDNDVAWLRTYHDEIEVYSEGGSWERGMTQFVGMKLFNRLFKVEAYRNALIAAVEDVKAHYLTPERVKHWADAYGSIIGKYLFVAPDNQSKRVTPEEFSMLVDQLPSEVELNYQYFLESLQKPWPFYVNLPQKTDDGKLNVNWEVSYDSRGEDITYSCYVAEDCFFENILAEKTGIRIPQYKFDLDLEPGRYFLRVRATNESGYTQDMFDYYSGKEVRGKMYGCMAFVVNEDGSISGVEESKD